MGLERKWEGNLAGRVESGSENRRKEGKSRSRECWVKFKNGKFPVGNVPFSALIPKVTEKMVWLFSWIYVSLKWFEKIRITSCLSWKFGNYVWNTSLYIRQGCTEKYGMASIRLYIHFNVLSLFTKHLLNDFQLKMIVLVTVKNTAIKRSGCTRGTIIKTLPSQTVPQRDVHVSHIFF